MPAEVRQAWDYAAPRYVRLDELHDAVGERIAAMIGCLVGIYGLSTGRITI